MFYFRGGDGVQMKFKMVSVLAVALVLAGCGVYPRGQAYWQRVEDSSALYMTGPKAQQRLEENLASCVREVDELVELDALREATPPDTNSDYRRALKASGDLDYYDTPTRLGEKKVAHTDYHDFEGCMRVKGWERVTVVRYQADRKSQQNYQKVKDYRETGTFGAEADAVREKRIYAVNKDYMGVSP